MSTSHDLKALGGSTLFISDEIEQIEQKYGVDLRPWRREAAGRDRKYFARFEEELRRAAATMSRHYEVFYCLENSIRDLVSDRMEAAFKETWWADEVDSEIRDEATKNRKREADMGVSLRSERDLDYITFGQLGQIIDKNWDQFAGVLKNRRAVSRIMTNLNMLRAPIAHCTPLAEDEVTRLRITLKDWFRQLE